MSTPCKTILHFISAWRRWYRRYWPYCRRQVSYSMKPNADKLVSKQVTVSVKRCVFQPSGTDQIQTTTHSFLWRLCCFSSCISLTTLATERFEESSFHWTTVPWSVVNARFTALCTLMCAAPSWHFPGESTYQAQVWLLQAMKPSTELYGTLTVATWSPSKNLNRRCKHIWEVWRTTSSLRIEHLVGQMFHKLIEN